MRRVFADSFYFFALVSEDDGKHADAIEFAATFEGEIITTRWVLTEVADGLAKPPWRETIAVLYERLIRNPSVRIVSCSDSLFDEGIALYRGRQDKSWSLTDCISFVVMKKEQLQEALTGDRDFEQAGFIALLK
ncbi:MAG TPA: PIN domain-containing protein [Pirellulaceae bacterium]|jgi:hypothetical protein